MTATFGISDAAIEAAAREMYLNDAADSISPDAWPAFDSPDNKARTAYLSNAAAALTAALPHIEAAIRADERARIVSELRTKYGVTNRAADWIARGANR